MLSVAHSAAKNCNNETLKIIFDQPTQSPLLSWTSSLKPHTKMYHSKPASWVTRCHTRQTDRWHTPRRTGRHETPQGPARDAYASAGGKLLSAGGLLLGSPGASKCDLAGYDMPAGSDSRQRDFSRTVGEVSDTSHSQAAHRSVRRPCCKRTSSRTRNEYTAVATPCEWGGRPRYFNQSINQSLRQ